MKLKTNIERHMTLEDINFEGFHQFCSWFKVMYTLFKFNSDS